MSTNANIQSIDNPFLRNGGLIWQRLHSEREDVCDTLLGESRPVNDTISGPQEFELSEESSRNVEWKHRELLQSRIRQLDDALDRLMAGSYGRCSECGKPLEDKRLAVDAAVSLCVACQRHSEGEHHFPTM